MVLFAYGHIVKIWKRDRPTAPMTSLGRDGESSQRGPELNETDPSRYPVKQAQSTVTRDQAKAELGEPLRTGDYVVAGEKSGLCSKVHPHMHAMQQAPTSAQCNSSVGPSRG